jgi:peptide methionine sulfoxide reductase msrA/msrB
LHGTERAHSSDLCYLFEPAKYACVCCGTELFDSGEKFDSGTGWPSFTQPIKENAVSYFKDSTYGMVRIETRCNVCDAHLGHVFQDGPPPSDLRYCINAIALKKLESKTRKATFGGGCFWCTEAIFQQLRGVLEVKSGYSGGHLVNPTYRLVCSGTTGHAEVVEITYDPEEISYEELLKVHLVTHNPTTPNQQGADKGTQYRSIIFYRNEEEKQVAEKVVAEVQAELADKIVTQLAPFEAFFPAEDDHHDYYNQNPENRYCQVVIEPKLEKFRKIFADKLKAD